MTKQKVNRESKLITFLIIFEIHGRLEILDSYSCGFQ